MGTLVENASQKNICQITDWTASGQTSLWNTPIQGPNERKRESQILRSSWIWKLQILTLAVLSILRNEGNPSPKVVMKNAIIPLRYKQTHTFAFLSAEWREARRCFSWWESRGKYYIIRSVSTGLIWIIIKFRILLPCSEAVFHNKMNLLFERQLDLWSVTTEWQRSPTEGTPERVPKHTHCPPATRAIKEWVIIMKYRH